MAKEKVNHPDHYNSGFAKCSGCGKQIECIDVIENLRFNLGNAIKYIWRAPWKGDIKTDLEKAKWYLDREIQKYKVPITPTVDKVEYKGAVVEVDKVEYKRAVVEYQE